MKWRFPEVGAEIENTAAGLGLLTNHELVDFDFRFSMTAKAMRRPTLHSSFTLSSPATFETNVSGKMTACRAWAG